MPTFRLVVRCLVLALALMLVGEGLALADTVTTVPSWQAQLIVALISFAGLILTTLLGVLLRFLIRKYHLDALAAHEDQLDGVIEQAIDYAEEQSYKAVKLKLPAKAGSEKLDSAVQFTLAKIDELGLEKRGAEAIKNALEAKLGATR